MRKIIAVAVAVVLLLSLCACSGTYVDKNGEPVEAKNGEVVFDLNGEFRVTKIDKSMYHIDNTPVHREYTAVLQNAEYTLVAIVEVEQYARWQIDDLVKGNIVGSYSVGYDQVLYNFKLADGTTFDISWLGPTDPTE